MVMRKGPSVTGTRVGRVSPQSPPPRTRVTAGPGATRKAPIAMPKQPGKGRVPTKPMRVSPPRSPGGRAATQLKRLGVRHRMMKP